MTTEAKLKKLEEGQIILEDQNCKLAKVGRQPGSWGTGASGWGSGSRLGAAAGSLSASAWRQITAGNRVRGEGGTRSGC